MILGNVHPCVASHPTWRAKNQVLRLGVMITFALTHILLKFYLNIVFHLPLHPYDISQFQIILAP